ncbi:Hypothetical protein NocV09_00203030 [Nannochloropsis oceanica]
MAIDGTSGRVTQRKRKRPLPASDSSKSTTTNSAPQRGGTCPKSASLSSSATTNSLSGNKKRSRSNTTHNGMSGEGDEMAAEDLDVDEEDGGRGAAACLESSLTSTAGGHGATGKTFTRAIDKPRARSEIVRQVEKLVSNMFKELDVLLRAENINRRVMYRWSGAERSSSGAIGEGKASYCTWGRELIKQYIEDAIELVRTSLTMGDWDNSVEAARRLTLQYLGKAADRFIIENEPVLHAEVMNTLGNLWFALLPYMPPPQRHQFRRLVARIRKTNISSRSSRNNKVGNASCTSTAAACTGILASGGAWGAVNHSLAPAATCVDPQGQQLELQHPEPPPPPQQQQHLYQHQPEQQQPQQQRQQPQQQQHHSGSLAVSFRCALQFAKLDLSPEALAVQGPHETQNKLAALLVSDVYECDAYICLWKVSEVLAGLKDFQVLCQEFRLKALDAEMWRCMLLEEQESRQRGGGGSDDEDDEDDYDSEEEEEEDEEGGKAEVVDNKDRLSISKLATIPGIMGMKKFENMQMICQHRSINTTTRSRPTGPFNNNTTTLTSTSSPGDVGEYNTCCSPNPASISHIQPVHPASSPAVIVLPTTTPATLPKKTAAAPSSRFSNIRRSSDREGQESGSRVAGAERWRTKAALEDGEVDQYMDFMSLHQHEYRRVVTPDFLFRVRTFLEAFETTPSALQDGRDGIRGTNIADAAAAPSLSPSSLLFVRSRPFLYRVATIIPTGQLDGYLDLLSSKIGFQATLLLLEPLLMDEQEIFSTGRVTQALEWAINHEEGRYLAVFSRLILPRIQSRTQLERIACHAVVYGQASLAVIDRALARVPRKNYEGMALNLCRRAVQNWGPGTRGVHLMVLRALQGMPSLGLYLKCRGCFSDPLPTLVRPLLHQLDPMGELSIGIRLVEGVVQSAVKSIVASLEASSEGPERLAKAKRWMDFAFAGVRGGQFPPCVLERLFSNQIFLLAALGPPSADISCVEAVAGCFSKLAELSRTHSTAIAGPVQAIMNTYTTHPQKHLIWKAANEKGIEVAA